MPLHRRSKSGADPVQVHSTATLAELIATGEKTMRKVWRTGKNGLNDPYWYIPAYTREGAINSVARRLREPAKNFDAN